MDNTEILRRMINELATKLANLSIEQAQAIAVAGNYEKQLAQLRLELEELKGEQNDVQSAE